MLQGRLAASLLISRASRHQAIAFNVEFGQEDKPSSVATGEGGEKKSHPQGTSATMCVEMKERVYQGSNVNDALSQCLPTFMNPRGTPKRMQEPFVMRITNEATTAAIAYWLDKEAAERAMF